MQVWWILVWWMTIWWMITHKRTTECKFCNNQAKSEREIPNNLPLKYLIPLCLVLPLITAAFHLPHAWVPVQGSPHHTQVPVLAQSHPVPPPSPACQELPLQSLAPKTAVLTIPPDLCQVLALQEPLLSCGQGVGQQQDWAVTVTVRAQLCRAGAHGVLS